MSTYPHVIESYVLSYICLDRRQALMHSDGEDYYEFCTFLYHTPCEHPLETRPSSHPLSMSETYDQNKKRKGARGAYYSSTYYSTTS